MSLAPSIALRLREVVAEVTELELASDDDDLLETGRIDSLTLVELIFALEQELGVELPLEELDVDHFRSLRAIAELVAVVSGEALGDRPGGSVGTQGADELQVGE